MITIPRNTTSRIQILTKPKQTEPQNKLKKQIPLIGATITEAAKMLGISRPHFYRLIKEGKVRTVKTGRRVLVSVQSLRDYVDGKKEPCNSAENSDELQGKNE